MASGARISPEKAGLIYDGLVEELIAAAKEGGVDFQPFGVISKEEDREVFYGHVTVLKGADHNTEAFSARVTITKPPAGRFNVDSFFDIEMLVVADDSIPTAEPLQSITLIEVERRRDSPRAGLKPPKEYVGHVTLLSGANPGDITSASSTREGEKKEFVGHVTLLRGAAGDVKPGSRRNRD